MFESGDSAGGFHDPVFGVGQKCAQLGESCFEIAAEPVGAGGSGLEIAAGVAFVAGLLFFREGEGCAGFRGVVGDFHGGPVLLGRKGEDAADERGLAAFASQAAQDDSHSGLFSKAARRAFSSATSRLSAGRRATLA